MFCGNCGRELDGTPEICANCGTGPAKVTASEQKRGRHTLLTVLNILAIAALVSTYIWLSLPPRIVKPIKATVSAAILATTGYSALPLHSISATPAIIPPLGNIGEVVIPPNFDVNDTQQLNIYAIYKNTTGTNVTKAVRVEDVTANCTYKSSDDNIVKVTAGGLVQAVAYGSADITAFYTAVPGSANITSAAQGKIPVTFTVTVPVSVAQKSLENFEATYG